MASAAPHAAFSYYAHLNVPVLSELPYWFLAIVAVSLGLTFGSFLNVVIYRLPREQSLVRPGSRCPACGAPIRFHDNVPVLSWLVLRARARCCGARISPRYPLVELLGGLFAWAVLEKLVIELPRDSSILYVVGLFALYLALGLGLLAAIFIDLEYMLLPDEITLGGAALGLLSAPLRGVGWVEAAVGAAVGFVIVWLPFLWLYRIIRGHPGMGLGDAKLVLLAGAWFGWPGAVFCLLAGAVQGTIVALTVYVARGRLEEPEAVQKERAELRAELERLQGEERARLEAEMALDPLSAEPEHGLGKARIAFGPFLAVAVLEYLFFGEVIVGEYVRWLTGT